MVRLRREIPTLNGGLDVSTSIPDVPVTDNGKSISPLRAMAGVSRSQS